MSVSDNIEVFIINLLKQENEINVQRNELASYFGCSPSQINYVLQTRFSVNRGYVIYSRKGSGGYVRIIRLSIEDDEYIFDLINDLSKNITEKEANDILRRLEDMGHINKREQQIIKAAVSDKALMEAQNKDGLRAGILKFILTQLLHEEE